MTLSLNTNVAASKAALHLAKNQENLNKSLDRLSSGKRITSAADDAGGLAVAMKMEANIKGLNATSNNIGNGISFLQAREGVLDQMGQVVSRMSELFSMTENLLLTDAEVDATVGSEYIDLSAQLTTLMAEQFNGVAFFGAASNHAIYTKDASTVSLTALNPAANAGITDAQTTTASEVRDGTVTATHIAAAVDYVSSLRADNASEMSTLQFAQETVQNEVTGLTAALGRIVDVDIASESANLAKQQILVQASASMVAQANSVNNAALLLLQ
jgi:flagellin